MAFTGLYCLLQSGSILQSSLYFHGIDTFETTEGQLFGFLDITFLFLTVFYFERISKESIWAMALGQ